MRVFIIIIAFLLFLSFLFSVIAMCSTGWVRIEENGLLLRGSIYPNQGNGLTMSHTKFVEAKAATPASETDIIDPSTWIDKVYGYIQGNNPVFSWILPDITSEGTEDETNERLKEISSYFEHMETKINQTFGFMLFSLFVLMTGAFLLGLGLAKKNLDLMNISSHVIGLSALFVVIAISSYSFAFGYLTFTPNTSFGFSYALAWTSVALNVATEILIMALIYWYKKNRRYIPPGEK